MSNLCLSWKVFNRSHWAPTGIIAFAFGDTILPEVQATVGGNAKKEMYKGISMGYSILLSSYMIVAIAGYWAFGYNVRLLLPISGRTLLCPNCHVLAPQSFAVNNM